MTFSQHKDSVLSTRGDRAIDLQGVPVSETYLGRKECLVWKHFPFQTCKMEHGRPYLCFWHGMLRNQRWDFRCVLNLVSETGASLLRTECDGEVWIWTALAVALVVGVTHMLHGLIQLGRPKRKKIYVDASCGSKEAFVGIWGFVLVGFLLI